MEISLFKAEGWTLCMKLQVSASTKPSLNSIKYTLGSFIFGEDCLCSLHTGLLPRTALGSFWKPSAVSNQPWLFPLLQKVQLVLLVWCSLLKRGRKPDLILTRKYSVDSSWGTRRNLSFRKQTFQALLLDWRSFAKVKAAALLHGMCSKNGCVRSLGWRSFQIEKLP